MNYNYNMVRKYLIKLEDENKELKDRIEKALEYINNTRVFGLVSDRTYMVYTFNNLRDILEGNNKDD